MPTFLEISGTEYPAEFEGNTIKPVAGISLVGTFAGEALERKDPLGFEHHGNLALRDGRWKIVSYYRKDQPTKWELYDMENDRTEQKDLGEEMPDKLAEMVGKWQTWADKVGVQPWPIKRKR